MNGPTVVSEAKREVKSKTCWHYVSHARALADTWETEEGRLRGGGAWGEEEERQKDRQRQKREERERESREGETEADRRGEREKDRDTERGGRERD